ncbi:MAG TPA: phosphatase PAP2 family protein [Gaiellaceae bacterium]|nr:phosphatase PAP2 family protein [Gaiellaceae bacterium]
MSAAAHAARGRILPNGYKDLLLQIAIWFGFLYAYRATRGVADRNAYEAFDNGLKVAGIERGFTGLWELSLQSFLHSSGFLQALASWTYWQSQFTFLGLALLWVYLRRNEAFPRWRNTIMLANLMGLVGYVVMPTAPPRMFPELGFVDTLNNFSISHNSGLVQLGSNPYAAMPSLHAADSLLIGLMLISVVRTRWLKPLFLLWPAWVWFSVMATGNHFWLDIVAGVAVALVALAIVNYRPLHRLVRRSAAAPA